MVEYQQKDKYSINDLVNIVKILRSKDGCPWDKVQTHESIRSDLLEETCEVLEAIDLKDTALLREELGDVLLHVVFHSCIEEEKNSFTFDDVCDEVCKKLIIRHPHVFGDLKNIEVDEVLVNWDSIKMKTKGQETYTDTLTSVANTLPALMRAQKIGKRAMRAGMDFHDVDDALACVASEKEELEKAIANGDTTNEAEELGDLLFSCVNVARHLNIDAEQALRESTNKFIKRFSDTEKLVKNDSLDMKELSIEQLDIYWEKAKKTDETK